jgi:photosystem II stability/assembly factor-like uncharacterized protein
LTAVSASAIDCKPSAQLPDTLIVTHGNSQRENLLVEVTDKVHYKVKGTSLFKSVNGGKTWNNIPIDVKGRNSRGEDVPFVTNRSMQWMDENNGYLYGDDGTFHYSIVILHTSDGGKTWTRHQPDIVSYSSSIPQIDIIDNKHHFAFYGYREYTASGDKEDKHTIFYSYSEDGGESFKLGKFKTGNLSKIDGQYQIELNPDGTGTISIEKKSWITTDFGKTWSNG